jgi:hypothetical protein
VHGCIYDWSRGKSAQQNAKHQHTDSGQITDKPKIFHACIGLLSRW